MFKREAEGESSMTISAQVIDTIVEWIDDNLHQPLRIEEIARHAGYSKWHLQRLFMQRLFMLLQTLGVRYLPALRV